MVVVPIFADRLYSFNYNPNGDGPDEFERLFDLWNDPEHLEEFFDLNKKDLQSGFYDPVPTIEEAIFITQSEAKRFEERLKHFSDGNKNSLDQVFKPLSEIEDHYPLPRYKSYGMRYKSWLRIYAIKIDYRYYITGGAIKITKSMNEREHTQKELRKLQRCLSWLEEEGITDIQGAKELDL